MSLWLPGSSIRRGHSWQATDYSSAIPARNSSTWAADFGLGFFLATLRCPQHGGATPAGENRRNSLSYWYGPNSFQIISTNQADVAADLMHTDPMSDLYQRKLTRARNAVEQIDNVRSIVRSMEKAMAYQKSLNATNLPMKLPKEETKKGELLWTSNLVESTVLSSPSTQVWVMVYRRNICADFL